MLCLVGLGLASELDLSLRAINVLSGCDVVYLEGYTGVFERLKHLENLLGRSISVLSREDVESKSEFIAEAKVGKVGLLVQGDPLSATTHISLLLDCVASNVKFMVVNGSSVFSAISRTGLSLYKFGKTASIPFPSKDYDPSSFYKIIVDNQRIKAHTLCLLDVRSDAHGYMTVPDALKILKKVDKKGFLKERVIGCSRLGYPDEFIKWGKSSTLRRVEWPGPPHCLVIPSPDLHFMEEEALKTFSD